MQTKNCEDGVFKRGKFSSSIAQVLARWRGERDHMCRGSITCAGVYHVCITISPHKCLNSGMLSHTFLRSTHSGVLIRTDLGLKPSALPHLKGSPSIGSAASHTHTIGIPIRRGSEVSLTTNFPFTPECGLSVSHRLDIMRSLRDLTRCNNAVVATLIRI